MKHLFIAEKKSVGEAFAKALGFNFRDRRTYLEADEAIVTWCRGHLVTMVYPHDYDEKYRRWQFETLPFIPQVWKYEVIPDAKQIYDTVTSLMKRDDVDVIYVCTDAAREGELIYRLVEEQVGNHGKPRKRVWIDSQTDEEILRGIREAKDLSAYDNLSDAAHLRAQVDYLMGINFSRALTITYGQSIRNYLKLDKCSVNVGRVMTCVLGMIVSREREIRNFVKTPFYKVLAKCSLSGHDFDGEWKAVEGSCAYGKDVLYKENGFKDKESAIKLISYLLTDNGQRVQLPTTALVEKKEKKEELKKPEALFNLAELQAECSKLFKISPDQTLEIAQELYEKKLTTYPRTDARVLSTAVSKEIDKNLKGLLNYQPLRDYAKHVLESGSYKTIGKNTKYVNDKLISDHYAIIPTGQTGAVSNLSPLSAKVYELIARRFMAIFFGPAKYDKISLVLAVKTEKFFANFKVLTDEGYLPIVQGSYSKKKSQGSVTESQNNENTDSENSDSESGDTLDSEFIENVKNLKKGSTVTLNGYDIKEGETSPPKRYTSGNLVLAMENAGQLIEDEELRAQIKGSGIGTSATRAEIISKLQNIRYIQLNKKTQILTPTQMGEMIYEVVNASMKPLLNPSLTASWEKGLTGVTEGDIKKEEYTSKVNDFITRRTLSVKDASANILRARYDEVAKAYTKGKKA